MPHKLVQIQCLMGEGETVTIISAASFYTAIEHYNAFDGLTDGSGFILFCFSGPFNFGYFVIRTTQSANKASSYIRLTLYSRAESPMRSYKRWISNTFSKSAFRHTFVMTRHRAELTIGAASVYYFWGRRV